MISLVTDDSFLDLLITNGFNANYSFKLHSSIVILYSRNKSSWIILPYIVCYNINITETIYLLEIFKIRNIQTLVVMYLDIPS